MFLFCIVPGTRTDPPKPRLRNRAQDLRQGRACPGAHPRPSGFRRQNLDAHPPGPSKKTKWTPTRPLGECLSNTPTHPAHRKRTKFGVGARSPLKRHPVARWPVGLEAGVPTSGACRWPLHLNFVIPGDPERFLCIHVLITGRTVLIEID